MIVIFIDNIEDFVSFLDRRVQDEIFYEFKEQSVESDLISSKDISIVLHFLSKIESSLTLYETNLSICKKNKEKVDEQVIKELQAIFDKVNPSLKLIKGKIREIFLSFSS